MPVEQTATSWAARFLEIGREAGVDVTNMKLQKLVTLAESASEYVRDTPAFHEEVQAWKDGPVVNSVYQRYKSFVRSPITAIEETGTAPLSDEDDLIAKEVWGIAGNLPAGGLRKLTHEVGPWPVHYRPGVWAIQLPGKELGAAWPKYVAYAQRLTQYRAPVETPVIGRGADGYRDDAQRAVAMATFRPGRPNIRAGA